MTSCRACGAEIRAVVDLGEHPAGGTFPLPREPSPQRLPLRLGVCAECGLAQLADPSPPEGDEPDAPTPLESATMAAHAGRFVDDLLTRGLASPSSRVLSLASHGGHLAPILWERGISATVLDPLPDRARRIARSGISAAVGSLDGATAPEIDRVGRFDLIVDFYLLAHLQHPRLALARMAGLLQPGGAIVLEFDHLLATIEGGQWDAIRHGHQSYLTLTWLAREAEAAGLRVVDAEPQPVYGGALRIILQVDGTASRRLAEIVEREARAAISLPEGLMPLRSAVELARREVVHHLETARASGRRVAGYGAPARSITFLNTLGIGPELLPFVVDRAPGKQGRLIPGALVPIRAPQVLLDDPPAEILVLTWDLISEIRVSLAPLVARGSRLIVALPGLADVTDAPRPAAGGEAPA